MTIRPLTIDDYDAMIDLWRSNKNFSGPGLVLRAVDDSREGIGRFFSRNPTSCFGAEENETGNKIDTKNNRKLIGTIFCGNDGRRGYIYHLAVDPAHRKQGIGRALVEAGLESLRKLGITKAALFVLEENEGGNAFWEKMGFINEKIAVARSQHLDERNVVM